MKPKSEIRVRKIMPNPNSEKNQVTVLLQQEFEGTGNKILALTQGGTMASKVVLAISFNADQAEKFFGTTSADYSETPFETWPTIDALEEAAGEKLAFSIIENLDKNPNNPKQQPKLNPKDNTILLYDGSPVYRHVELVTADQAKIQLLQHNGFIPAEAFVANEEEAAVEMADAFGATSEN